jgi:hypothetical protein
MSARRKLNGAYLAGALVVAWLVGLATGSATVFAVALAALVGVGLVAGDIRPGGPR